MSPELLINLTKLEMLLNTAQKEIASGKTLSPADRRRLDKALDDLAAYRVISGSVRPS